MKIRILARLAVLFCLVIGLSQPGWAQPLDAQSSVAIRFGNMPETLITNNIWAYGSFNGSAFTDGDSQVISRYLSYRAVHGGYTNYNNQGYGFYTQGPYPRMFMEVISGDHGNFTNLPVDSPIRNGYLYQQIKGPTAGDLTAPIKATNSNSNWLWGIKYNGDAIFEGGKMGIGTADPAAKLHVADDVLVSGSANGLTVDGASSYVILNKPDDTTPSALLFRIANTERWGFHYIGTSLQLNNSNVAGDFLINPMTGGNVGIGTVAPGYKLDVAGTARAEEIIVQTSGADFVFEDDYDLRSLEELERYIQEHGHLPEIPSAEQMRAEGMQVGDMQTKLLQKIEELTLYIIAQEKRAVAQEQRAQEQQKRIDVLSARLEQVSVP
jgi:hypothetical protein